MVVIHKSLNLTTWLPDNAFKWAGGEVTSLGEQSDERRIAAVFGQVQSQGNMARMMNRGSGGPSGGATPKPKGDGGGGGDDNEAEAPGANTGKANADGVGDKKGGTSKASDAKSATPETAGIKQ